MTTRIGAVLLAVSILLAGHQQVDAGLLDSPPPTFDGIPGQVTYRMGAIYYEPTKVDTMVKCTNMGEEQAMIALELFDQADNPAGTVAYADLAVGDTITFATSANWAKGDWVVVQQLMPLDSGKARVSATTTRLSCTGYHLYQASDGSIQNRPLRLIKKVSPGTAEAR
jgi:hypothetical protein